jgi:hypothetical protein
VHLELDLVTPFTEFALGVKGTRSADRPGIPSPNSMRIEEPITSYEFRPHIQRLSTPPDALVLSSHPGLIWLHDQAQIAHAHASKGGMRVTRCSRAASQQLAAP